MSAIVNGIDTPEGTEIRFHVHIHMRKHSISKQSNRDLLTYFIQ